MSQPVRLISADEKLVLSIGDSRFIYRRIRAAEKQNILQKHTTRGQINQTAAAAEIIRTCLKGWENVVDDKGEDIPFSHDLIEGLPEMVLMQIEVAVLSASGEVYQKN